jgi:hypothetical protein
MAAALIDPITDYYNPLLGEFNLVCSLDDSGSDDLSEITAIGGVVMSADAEDDFGSAWIKMLRPYRVDPPLHLTEFIGPYGKYAGMYPELKKSLFNDVADLVQRFRLYSLSVTLRQQDFSSVLGDDVRRNLIGPYAFTFFSAVLANGVFSKNSFFFGEEPIAYLVDTGFSFASQLGDAHKAIIKTQERKQEASWIGPLEFRSDSEKTTLQVADVVSGCARMRTLKGSVPSEFAGVDAVFADRHAEIKLDASAIQMLAKPINNWIAGNGAMPSLTDILR